MFDPERDLPPPSAHFVLRLAVVALVTTAIAAAMWPSATGFRTGADGERSCVAVLDGWRPRRADPGPAAAQAAQSSYLEWTSGDGACIAPSRHRLIVSGLGLLAITIVTVGTVLALRLRTREAAAP